MSISCLLQVYNIQNELSNIDPLDLEFTKQLLDKIDAVDNALKRNVTRSISKLDAERKGTFEENRRRLIKIIITKTSLLPVPSSFVFLHGDLLQIVQTNPPDQEFWVNVHRSKLSVLDQNGQRTLLLYFEPTNCSGRKDAEKNGVLDIIFRCNTAMKYSNMGIQTSTKPLILSSERDAQYDSFISEEFSLALHCTIWPN